MGLYYTPSQESEWFHSLLIIQPPLPSCQWQPSCSPADDTAMQLEVYNLIKIEYVVAAETNWQTTT